MSYSVRFCIVVGVTTLLLLSETALGNQDMSDQQEIINAIENVRTTTKSGGRNSAAWDLAILLHKTNSKGIDDKTLAEIISLLDFPEARAAVSSALGDLGSRATSAVPRLLQLLNEEDCTCSALVSELSIARHIRDALCKLGVSPPARKCGEKLDECLKEIWGDY